METLAVNGRDCTLLRLLGKGKGGYSYLASDGEKTFVLKQIHHEPCAYYQFGDKLQSELNDYARLCALGLRLPALIEVDRENERLLKEYIPGETVMDLVKRGPVPEACFRQVRAMCALLEPAGLNIDWFPTNFVLSEADGLLYYIDYECNSYMDEWSFENWGCRYWSQTEELQAYLAAH